MALSRKMDQTLKILEQSHTSEGIAIAECLRTIASNNNNNNDDENVDMSSDEFLLSCAKETRRWIDMLIAAFDPEVEGRKKLITMVKEIMEKVDDQSLIESYGEDWLRDVKEIIKEA